MKVISPLMLGQIHVGKLRANWERLGFNYELPKRIFASCWNWFWKTIFYFWVERKAETHIRLSEGAHMSSNDDEHCPDCTLPVWLNCSFALYSEEFHCNAIDTEETWKSSVLVRGWIQDGRALNCKTITAWPIMNLTAWFPACNPSARPKENNLSVIVMLDRILQAFFITT